MTDTAVWWEVWDVFKSTKEHKGRELNGLWPTEHGSGVSPAKLSLEIWEARVETRKGRRQGKRKRKAAEVSKEVTRRAWHQPGGLLSRGGGADWVREGPPG